MKKRLTHTLIPAVAAVMIAAAMSSCDVMTGYWGMDVGTDGPIGTNIGISVPLGGYGPYYRNPPVSRPMPRPMPPMRPMRPAPIGPFFPY